MIDALVISEAVQRAVDTFTNVAHWFLGGTHVDILYVTLETR